MTERRQVRTPDGSFVSYLTVGDGPAVVLLPDTLDEAADFDRFGYFDALGDRFRVMAIDTASHALGDSRRDADSYMPEAVAGRIIQVLASAHVSSVCLWGFGTGAETASVVARRRTDIIGGLVVGGTHLGDLRVFMRSQGLEHDALITRSISRLRRGDWQAYFDGLPDAVPPERQAEIIERVDPEIVAAVIGADLVRPRAFVTSSVPTFAYWASGSMLAEPNTEAAAHLPGQSAVFKGSHCDSFRLCGPVMELVTPFLDRWSAESEREPDRRTL